MPYLMPSSPCSPSCNPSPGELSKKVILLLECVGDNVVAHVEGKKALRATSQDFHVKKPGIEFGVLGRNRTEVSFDNLRVWELTPTAIAVEAPMEATATAPLFMDVAPSGSPLLSH